MQTNNDFKQVWWVLWIVALLLLLNHRYDVLVQGKALPTDYLIVTVLGALILLPLFQEVTLFGLKFKAQIDHMRNDIMKEIISVRAEFVNRVSVSNSNHINISGVPSPSTSPEELSQLRNGINSLGNNGANTQQPADTANTAVIENRAVLAQYKELIETELLRILRSRYPSLQLQEVIYFPNIIRALEAVGVEGMTGAALVREIYSICTAATHGEPLTDEQIDLGRTGAPKVLSLLRRIE